MAYLSRRVPSPPDDSPLRECYEDTQAWLYEIFKPDAMGQIDIMGRHNQLSVEESLFQKVRRLVSDTQIRILISSVQSISIA